MLTSSANDMWMASLFIPGSSKQYPGGIPAKKQENAIIPPPFIPPGMKNMILIHFVRSELPLPLPTDHPRYKLHTINL